MESKISNNIKTILSKIALCLFAIMVMLPSGCEVDTWQYWIMIIGCLGVYFIGVLKGTTL